MILVLIVMFLVALLFIILSIFILCRNDKVYTFRIDIISMCHRYNMYHVIRCLEYTDAYSRFLDKYTYNRMIFSFKPLKLKYWFTEEEIKELTKYYKQ